ncbi:Zn-finger domain of CDGSH type-containing protein [Geodermatophilus sp. DSM 45219]|nr:Zn-finger domain of CDGSH type-containing protein [Geodermatophilus sp. DSM 45219]
MGVPTAPPGQGRGVSQPAAAPDPIEDPAPSTAGGATITPYRDGPLIVRGDFRLLDQDGAEIDPGRETIALCRCGKSGIKPFCDGSHKRAGFSAPSAPSRPRPAARILRQGPEGDPAR